MYYKVRFVWNDEDNNRHEYYAYTTANNKDEARENVVCELTDNERDDRIDAVIEITEEEYVKGYREFGNGIR